MDVDDFLEVIYLGTNSHELVEVADPQMAPGVLDVRLIDGSEWRITVEKLSARGEVGHGDH